MIELAVVSPHGEVRTYSRKATKRSAVCASRIGAIACGRKGASRTSSPADQEIRETRKRWLASLDTGEIGGHVIAAKFHARTKIVFTMRPGQPVCALKLIFLNPHAEDGIRSDHKLVGDIQGRELVNLRSEPLDANLRICERNKILSVRRKPLVRDTRFVHEVIGDD